MFSIRFFAPACAALSLLSVGVYAQGAANPDFQAVTSKLDPGGSFYLFADTRGAVDKVADMVERFTSAVPDRKMRAVPGIVRVGGDRKSTRLNSSHH